MRVALVVALLGVPVGAASILAACGSNNSNGSSPGGDSGPADGTTAEGSPGDAAGDSVLATDSPPDAGPVRCTDFNPDKNVYWGDLHTHTALSGDAYGWGNRNFPHDAYRFASDPSAQTPIAAG